MSDLANMAGSPFWTFTLSVYRRRGVDAACITLQDRCGLDVNFLLLCLFAGSRGRRLSDDDFERIERHVAPWRRAVIHPLRSVRRWLKEQTHRPNDAVEGLRRGVLAQEIEAEGHQQRMMETLVALAEGPADPYAAADNLLRYLTVSNVAVDDDIMSKLATLLSAASADLDYPAAMDILSNRSRTAGVA